MNVRSTILKSFLATATIAFIGCSGQKPSTNTQATVNEASTQTIAPTDESPFITVESPAPTNAVIEDSANPFSKNYAAPTATPTPAPTPYTASQEESVNNASPFINTAPQTPKPTPTPDPSSPFISTNPGR